MPPEQSSPLGQFLRQHLRAQGLTLREAAQRTGLDPATLSRLLTGKQPPRPEHLRKLATALGCDPLELWRQAGFLAASPAALPQVEREQVAAELAKYRLYAETAEGHEMIVQHFLPKLQQLQAAGQLIDQLRAMYDLYMDPATAPVRCHVLGSVLLYFVLATDLIPDYLFPVGYLDDALAIELTWPQVQPWLAERAAQPTDDPAPGE